MKIVVAVAGARARLVVEDHGIGIPREHQARIFERFERTEAARRLPGCGIGLWVVREIIAALEGTVEVEGADGAGAKFTIELPGILPGRRAAAEA